MIQKKITFDSFIRGILTAMVIIGILYLVNRLSSYSRHSGQFHKRAHRYVENTRSAERKQFCEYHA